MKTALLVYITTLLILTGNASLAATFQLTVNQSSFSPGNQLQLSAVITPVGDAGQAVDLYIALVTPSGDILTLDPNLNWVPSLQPIARGFALANLHADSFYSMVLPAGVPNGFYSFHLVAVSAGRDPANSNNWLGNSAASFVFTGGGAAGVELTTRNGLCSVNQYCDVALVAGVIGGSTPYTYHLGSLAYGTPPSLMTVDLLTGNLEGTPSLAGTYNFQICARDIGGNQDCQPVTVTVSGSSNPGTPAWVFIGGSVATFGRVTLDGIVIKESGTANLSHYMYMTPGTHTLSATCVEVYCFAYMQLEAPSGYTFTPTELRATPEEIPPGVTKTFTFTLTRNSN